MNQQQEIKQLLDVGKTVSCRVVVGKKNGNLISVKDNGKIMIPTKTLFTIKNSDGSVKILSELTPETRLLGVVVSTHDTYDNVELFCAYDVNGTLIIAPAYADYTAYSDQLRFIAEKPEWASIQNEIKEWVAAGSSLEAAKTLCL